MVWIHNSLLYYQVNIQNIISFILIVFPHFFTGRFDFNVSGFHCSKCNRSFNPLELDNVIQLGYWPGTIANTKYLFAQDLLKKWDLLQKRLPGSSESGFLRSLEDLSISKGRVG